MKTVISFLVISTVLLFSSCKKVEGPGGSSTIKGEIIAEVTDGFGNVVGTFSPGEEDVYIIYGGDDSETFYDDDTKTSYDGSFEFRYLEPGTYRVFVYSKDNNVYGGKVMMMQEVKIDSKKQTVEMDPFVIRK